MKQYHVTPFKDYFTIFVILLVLTIVTVLVAQPVSGIDLGPLSNFVALLIATIKAFCVMAVFMHLKYESLLNRVIFGCSFFFLIIFFTFSALDIFTRVVEVLHF